MRKRNLLITIALLATFFSAFYAMAAPSSVFEPTLLPQSSNNFDLGSTGAVWRNGYITQLCLSGDCRTVWPAGGGGGSTFATSSLSALYPVIYTQSSSLAQFSLAFGTTTANAWSALQQFNGNASTTGLTVSGPTFASGKVSIGSTTPDANLSKLFIENNSGAGSDGITVENTTAAAHAYFYLTDSIYGNNFWELDANGSATANTNLLNIPLSGVLRSGGGTTGGLIFDAQASGAPIKFATGGFANSNVRAIIDTAGNFGIGTTSPYKLLSIGGDAVIGASAAGGTAGDLYLPKLGTAAGSFLAVDAVGKVIATTTPSAGTGSVTSVALTVPSFLSVSGSPITTSGTLGVTLSGTALPILNGGTGTTTAPVSQLLYGGTGGIYQSVATSTLSASAPLTGSFTQLGSGGALGCQTATGSQAGCLSSTDWNTFNGKQATISATWPITLSGAAVGFNGLSTSTAAVLGNVPYFSGVNTFANVATTSVSNGSGISFTGTPGALLGGTNLTINNTGVLSLTQNGGGTAQAGALTFATSSQTTNGLTTGLNITNSSGTFTFAPTISGTLTVAGGGTGQTSFSAGNLLYGAGSGALQNVATSSLGVSASFSYSGTLGALVGGAGGTLSIASGGVSNAMLANSTISGVALGGSLFAHTHDSTLSGTSYNGSAAVSDWGINLGNANTWSATQTFGTINVGGGSGQSISGPALNQIAISGSSEIARFTNAGLGIGTTTPQNPLSIKAGTVSVPSISFGDTATGIFRSALSAIGWAVSGVEKMTLNATGLGVGSTTPSTLLSVGTPATPGTILDAENTLSTTTSMTIDFKSGNQQLLRTGTPATSIAFTNALPGASLRLIVCNPGASAGAVTFSGVEWAGGTVPTQTTTLNQCDVWSFVVTQATSTTKIFGAQSAAFQ